MWLGDIPVATLRPNGSGGIDVFYVHADHLNSPRLVTDTANTIRWRWDSDSFGTTPPNENPSGMGAFAYNLRFPGQQYDATVGVHYNYFRDYDPTIGRYVESDPIGLRGGPNTYAYVQVNPISRTDPTGLVRECPLRLQIFLAMLPLTRINIGSLWLCTYDCNTSCPEDRSLIFTVIELRFYPDWGCRRTYLLY